MVARNSSVTTSSHYDRKRTDVTPRCLEKQDAQSIMGIAKHHGPSGRDAVEKSADFKILDSRCEANFADTRDWVKFPSFALFQIRG